LCFFVVLKRLVGRGLGGEGDDRCSMKAMLRRDPHLVQVRVGRELREVGDTRLPAEAASVAQRGRQGLKGRLATPCMNVRVERRLQGFFVEETFARAGPWTVTVSSPRW